MRKQPMVKLIEKSDDTETYLDATLIRAFLKLTPEERIRANDKAIQAVMESRDAFEKQKATWLIDCREAEK
jgi:hypothetical protein